MIDLTEEQIKEIADKFPESLINLPNQYQLSEKSLIILAKVIQERAKEPSTLDHLISTVNASKKELGEQTDEKQREAIEILIKESSKLWEHTDFFSHADLPDSVINQEDKNIKK